LLPPTFPPVSFLGPRQEVPFKIDSCTLPSQKRIFSREVTSCQAPVESRPVPPLICVRAHLLFYKFVFERCRLRMGRRKYSMLGFPPNIGPTEVPWFDTRHVAFPPPPPSHLYPGFAAVYAVEWHHTQSLPAPPGHRLSAPQLLFARCFFPRSQIFHYPRICGRNLVLKGLYTGGSVF